MSNETKNNSITYLDTFKNLFTHSKEGKASKGESKRHYFVAKKDGDGHVHCVWKSKKVQESNASLKAKDFAEYQVAIIGDNRYTLCSAPTVFEEADSLR
jgi:hypothetical protein